MKIFNYVRKIFSSKNSPSKMKVAHNFIELCSQTALWFLNVCHTYPERNKNDLVDSMFNEDLQKKEIQKFFNYLTGLRYQIYPDKISELWLKNRPFEHGLIGYILDIIYIESDNTSLLELPVTLKELVRNYPDEAELLMREWTREIATTLYQDPTIVSYVPLFGNIYNDDTTERINIFCRGYIATLKD